MYLRTLDSALTAGCPRITILSWLCRGRHGCAESVVAVQCKGKEPLKKNRRLLADSNGGVFLPFVLLYALRRRVRIRTVIISSVTNT
jgi:hypothetical protein